MASEGMSLQHQHRKTFLRAPCVPAAVCLFAVLAMAPAAYAAHPLQTEDTGTQGTGNVELENGLLWSRSAGNRLFSYQPQFSWGLSSSFDLIVQPSWLSSQDSGSPAQRGRGDTNLDIKWRFAAAQPWSLALRAGLTLPTSTNNGTGALGLPDGRYGSHALLAVTWDAAVFTMHANLGLALNPQGSGARARVATASAAMMWVLTERIALTLDCGQSSNPDPRRTAWEGSTLAGVIYSVQPGLDVDLGYQTSWRAAQPSHQWLLGLTYRFAP